jgi:hypothetical protein
MNSKLDPGSVFPDSAPPGFRPPITLHSQTPLTREEVAYAVRTLLEWHKVRLVQVAPGLIRAEAIPQK